MDRAKENSQTAALHRPAFRSSDCVLGAILSRARSVTHFYTLFFLQSLGFTFLRPLENTVSFNSSKITNKNGGEFLPTIHSSILLIYPSFFPFFPLLSPSSFSSIFFFSFSLLSFLFYLPVSFSLSFFISHSILLSFILSYFISSSLLALLLSFLFFHRFLFPVLRF